MLTVEKASPQLVLLVLVCVERRPFTVVQAGPSSNSTSVDTKALYRRFIGCRMAGFEKCVRLQWHSVMWQFTNCPGAECMGLCLVGLQRYTSIRMLQLVCKRKCSNKPNQTLPDKQILGDHSKASCRDGSPYSVLRKRPACLNWLRQIK